MDFRIDRHSDLPIATQFQVQIKIALLLGKLRPGDTLPSIRDVEKQLGISRNFVLQAYRALQKNGILKLHHGKGVLVREHSAYSNNPSIVEKADFLAQESLRKAEKLGILPSAFGRYVYQRAIEGEASEPKIFYADVGKSIAAERASYVSNFWRVNIPSLSFDELASLPQQKLGQIMRVLTNYIRYDEVKKIVQKTNIEVIPLGLIFTEEARLEFYRLPKDASVCFIFDNQDFPWLQLIVAPYKELLTAPSVQFIAKAFRHLKGLRQLVQSGRYSKVVVSNRLWEDLPESIRALKGVTRPQLRIDPASLEEARIKAGVIV